MKLAVRSVMFGALAVGLVALAGCDLAPTYKVPLVSVPVDYKEAGQWQQAKPADALPRGAWWTMYGDATLNGLEDRVDGGSPTLAAALAIYQRATAIEQQAEAGLFPSLFIGGRVNTDRQSDRRPLRGRGQPNQYLDNAITAQATYEVDLWDRVANTIKAGKSAAQASAADLETLRLSLHAELASDYLTMRSLDIEAGVLRDTVAAYSKALQLVQNRLAGKIASELDVTRAQTQLSFADAQVADIAARRALLEHAVAVLVGLPPAELSIAPVIVDTHVPVVATGLPSTLLQRRPDIASAERLVAAANATIGVAKAAFYPTLSLNLIYGLEDTGFNIFSLPNDFWAIGPGLAMPLFEGGLRDAQEAAAVAAYQLAVANYKQAVLTAFQQVEDNLALLRFLGDEEHSEDAAVAAAKQTVTMSMALYTDGAISYLEVVTAQEAELQAEQTAIALHARRLEASVGLIRALGGGWERSDLPEIKS
jgi:NodT family efflux transporter outer membrane factor (OMF) lipoprotein